MPITHNPSMDVFVTRTNITNLGIPTTVQGQQDMILTPNTFIAAESSNFNYDNMYVVFDGSIKLNTGPYSITVSSPTAFSDGYISESAPISFANISGVNVT